MGASSGTLSSKRCDILAHPDTERFFSAFSLWEMAKLMQLGRITVPESYLDDLYRHPHYSCVPITPAVLRCMIEVSSQMHRDPADQMIVATARYLNAALMTDDGAIRNSELVELM